MNDRAFMDRALALAREGVYRVEPNPPVGALVVRAGEVVGEGFHAVFGGPHAETVALRTAGDLARGSQVYVTLEPCGHHGKTPPCAEALRDAGVARVVYAAPDPNPETTGVGPALLREAGIEVVAGVGVEEARALESRFIRHLASEIPWTVAKWAMSLDGKISDVGRQQGAISGPESHALVHEIRGAVDAVVVGVGTVRADDPDLTARGVDRTREAVRVIVDSSLGLSPESKVVRTAGHHATWIATHAQADAGRANDLEALGCRILRVPGPAGRVDLAELWRRLKSEGVARLLLEGGGEMHASALAADLVHQVIAFVAPILLGGRTAPTPVDGEGLRRIDKALRLHETRVQAVGQDVLVEGFVAR